MNLLQRLHQLPPLNDTPPSLELGRLSLIEMVGSDASVMRFIIERASRENISIELMLLHTHPLPGYGNAHVVHLYCASAKAEIVIKGLLKSYKKSVFKHHLEMSNESLVMDSCFPSQLHQTRRFADIHCRLIESSDDKRIDSINNADDAHTYLLSRAPRAAMETLNAVCCQLHVAKHNRDFFFQYSPIIHCDSMIDVFMTVFDGLDRSSLSSLLFRASSRISENIPDTLMADGHLSDVHQTLTQGRKVLFDLPDNTFLSHIPKGVNFIPDEAMLTYLRRSLGDWLYAQVEACSSDVSIKTEVKISPCLDVDWKGTLSVGSSTFPAYLLSIIPSRLLTSQHTTDSTQQELRLIIVDAVLHGIIVLFRSYRQVRYEEEIMTAFMEFVAEKKASKRTGDTFDSTKAIEKLDSISSDCASDIDGIMRQISP